MMNRPLDLLDLLTLLWNEEWSSLGPSDPSQEDYQRTNSGLEEVVCAETIDRSLWILDPVTYKEWATPVADVGFLKPSEAIKFIPPILKLLQLKRTAATTISDVPNRREYRIGAEIPPVRWVTVELQMNRHKLQRYAAVHAFCTGNLGAGFDDRNNTGIRHMTFHRKLCLAIFCPELDRVSSCEDRSEVVEKHYH